MRKIGLFLALVGAAGTLSGCYRGPGTDSTTSAVSTPEPNAKTASASSQARVAAPPKFGSMRYSFVDHYSEGKINSEAEASTPTKRGALLLRTNVNGTKLDSLTVLSTYRYSFSLKADRGTVLAFTAAKPFEIGIAARGFVDVNDGSKTDRVFVMDLPPANADGPQWHPFTKPLDRYAGKNVTITFGTDVVDGNATATWVSFAYAGIYTPERASRKTKNASN